MVDVAGGIGTQTKILAKEFDHLKHVVQDLPVVMSEEAPMVLNLGSKCVEWAVTRYAFEPIRSSGMRTPRKLSLLVELSYKVSLSL